MYWFKAPAGAMADESVEAQWLVERIGSGGGLVSGRGRGNCNIYYV